MNLTSTIIKRLLKRKIATALLLSASMAAFAISGDGTVKVNPAPAKSNLTFSSRNFSLRTGYNYRSNNILSLEPEKKYIMVNNTVTTYQRGNATYVLPLKKKVILDKIKFNPAN